MVEITGKAIGGPHGFVNVLSKHSNKAKVNKLACIRTGNWVIVRSLQLSAIHQTVVFPVPRGTKFLARQRSRSTGTLLAAQPAMGQRMPATESLR